MHGGEENVQATDAQVMLALTGAYYQVLQAQHALKVAEETVAAREVNLTQIKALMESGLKSSLDVSFAEVNMSDAKLLLIKTQNDLNSARTVLSTAMGYRDPEIIEAREEPLPVAIISLDTAITEALYRRPDLHPPDFSKP